MGPEPIGYVRAQTAPTLSFRVTRSRRASTDAGVKSTSASVARMNVLLSVAGQMKKEVQVHGMSRRNNTMHAVGLVCVDITTHPRASCPVQYHCVPHVLYIVILNVLSLRTR